MSGKKQGRKPPKNHGNPTTPPKTGESGGERNTNHTTTNSYYNSYKFAKPDEISIWEKWHIGIDVGLTVAIICITIVSLIYTSDQVDISRESMQVENRAYLSSDSIRLYYPDNSIELVEGDQLIVGVKAHNFSKTPANSITKQLKIQISKEEISDKNASDTLTGNNWTLGINQTQEYFTLMKPITKAQEIGMKQDTFHIHIHITLSYKDVFKKLHETSIYGFIDPKTNNFFYLPKWNYAN